MTVSEETARRIADALERLATAIERTHPMSNGIAGAAPRLYPAGETFTICAYCGMRDGQHQATCPTRWHATNTPVLTP